MVVELDGMRSVVHARSDFSAIVRRHHHGKNTSETLVQIAVGNHGAYIYQHSVATQEHRTVIKPDQSGIFSALLPLTYETVASVLL